MKIYIIIGIEYGWEEGDSHGPPHIIFSTRDEDEANNKFAELSEPWREGGFRGQVVLEELEIEIEI